MLLVERFGETVSRGMVSCYCESDVVMWWIFLSFLAVSGFEGGRRFLLFLFCMSVVFLGRRERIPFYLFFFSLVFPPSLFCLDYFILESLKEWLFLGRFSPIPAFWSFRPCPFFILLQSKMQKPNSPEENFIFALRRSWRRREYLD